MQCRFCWCSEEDEGNPLILACKCRGSVGLIHFQCLKNWIKTQRHVKDYGENVTSYYWKKFECEICKQSYPYIFKKGNDLFKLIDIAEPKPDAKYILLESMPLDKNTSRNIHMLTVTDKKTEFKLGRGHESEVRINDISVSRCHAIIKCRKDGFYIEDNLSKFGTIVLLKNTLRLAEDHTMAVQVGRSVVSFTIKNIDVDRKMREKLKREIAPLLSCNKNKNLGQNGASNNTEAKKEAQADNNNGNGLSNIPERANSMEEPGLNSNMVLNAGLVGSEGSMNRNVQEPASLSAVRTASKNVNMLQRNRLNEMPGDAMSNGNNLGLMSDYRTTTNNHISNVYGQGDRAQLSGNATNNMSLRERPDRDGALHSASNVSHSALVNSGNAAILGLSNGLNSFKLNSNNNNSGNGPAALGGAYGAVGTTHGLHGPSEQERGRSV